MKQHLYKLIGLVVLTFTLWSCSDNPLELLNGNSPQAMSTSRSTSEPGVSITNPDLISDWENQDIIYINRMQPNCQPTPVLAPWAEGYATENLTNEFCKDVKKENGWMMLFHTFEEAGFNENLSYMFLYNLFTGVMKVFYYSESPVTAAYFQWCLYHEGTPLKMLEAPDFITKIDSEPMPTATSAYSGLYLSNESVPNTSIFAAGWNGFEYRVRRYAQEDIGFLTLTSKSKVYTNITLNGILNLKTSGTVTSITTPQTETHYNTTVGAFTGEKVKPFLNSLQNASTIGSEIIQLLATGATPETLIAGGLKKIFGYSSVTKYKTESDVRLETEGEIELNGEAVTEIGPVGVPIKFNLNNIMYGGRSLTDNEPKLLNLGVWTLKSYPKVYYDMITKINVSSLSNLGDKNNLEVYGTMPYPPIASTGLPEIELNPFIKQYIKSYDISMELVDYRPAGLSTLGSGENPPFRASDLLIEDKTHSLYRINRPLKNISVMTTIGGHQVTENTKFYYQWTKPIQDRVVAMVTVKMNIDYLGHEFTVEETRAYRTKAYTSPATSNPDSFHNIPTSAVVNYKGSGWVTSVPKEDM